MSGAVIGQAEPGAGRTMTGAVIDQAELDVLRRHWHPVARSDAIDSGPVGVVLLGEPLVVFRLGGRACVASDRCPHRGSPLSLGSYDDDCLVCPYHGLRYSADGQCVGFPARPDARLPQRLSLHTLPTRECHGLVWACPDEPAADDLPDWGFYDRPDVQTFQIGPVRWHASASRVAENFNDIAHFSTIHRVTFGPSDRPVAPQQVTATDTGFTSTVGVFQQYRNTLDGSVTEVEAAYRYDFTFPFSSMLTITYPDGELECIQLVSHARVGHLVPGVPAERPHQPGRQPRRAVAGLPGCGERGGQGDLPGHATERGVVPPRRHRRGGPAHRRLLHRLPEALEVPLLDAVVAALARPLVCAQEITVV